MFSNVSIRNSARPDQHELQTDRQSLSNALLFVRSGGEFALRFWLDAQVTLPLSGTRFSLTDAVRETLALHADVQRCMGMRATPTKTTNMTAIAGRPGAPKQTKQSKSKAGVVSAAATSSTSADFPSPAPTAPVPAFGPPRCALVNSRTGLEFEDGRRTVHLDIGFRQQPSDPPPRHLPLQLPFIVDDDGDMIT